MKRNKLISIGYKGLKRVYLNMSKAQAMARYKESEDIERIGPEIDIEVIYFDDEFYAYEVGECLDG